MNSPRLELVAAVARNGVIGRQGQLPWHLPEDLKHFKRLTLGHVVIMGRKTFESVNSKPLPGRRNIIISSKSGAIAGVEVLPSLEAATALLAGCTESIFVVGGSGIFAAALPIAQAMHLTELDEAVEGDIFFPPFDRSQWKVVREVRHEKDDRHAMGF